MILNHHVRITLFLCAALMVSCESGKEKQVAEDAPGVEYWLTTGDKSILLQPVPGNIKSGATEGVPSIKVDTTKTFQTMDGFGFSLTGGSAWLLHEKLSPEKRSEILKELFTTDGNNIGVSYLRISIGASDLDDHVFSYADYTPGRKAKDLSGFTIEEDRKYLIPVLKEILELNPSIKIMGSPWSAPFSVKT